MKRFFKAIAAALALPLLLCCGCGIIPGQPDGDTETQNSKGFWRYTDTAMGTVIWQSIYAAGEDAAQKVSREIMDYLDNLEQEKLSWRLDTSEVYKINASAGSPEGYQASEEMASLLRRCKELYQQSDGAFDATLGPVVRLWNIDQWAAGGQTENFCPPSSQTLADALRKTGSDKLVIEETPSSSEQTIRTYVYIPQGTGIDLGAVGKGYALAEIRNLLEQNPEVTGAVISVGGSVLTYGEKPDGSSWKVGITDPFDTSATIGVLSLRGEWCVSTSGDYERYMEADGVRYHHILNPATGYPADSGVRSVTVLSKDGLLSDGLSTACFILGPEKGMELAVRYDAEVLFILDDGEVVMSEGMEGYYQ